MEGGGGMRKGGKEGGRKGMRERGKENYWKEYLKVIKFSEETYLGGAWHFPYLGK
jgi:hypothetical protein